MRIVSFVSADLAGERANLLQFFVFKFQHPLQTPLGTGETRSHWGFRTTRRSLIPLTPAVTGMFMATFLCRAGE